MSANASGCELAIVAAMPREINRLVKGWESSTLAGDGYYWKLWRRGDVAVICVGTGYQRAFIGTKVLIECLPPKVVTSVGFAGAASGQLHAGDVFTPTEVVRSSDGTRYSCGEGCGLLVTTGEVASSKRKAELAKRFGAVAVDMEAAGVAEAAKLAGIEFRALKAVSDEVGAEMDFTSPFLTPDGFATGRFLAHIALRPCLWRPVAHLAANSRLAEASLTGALQQLTAGYGA